MSIENQTELVPETAVPTVEAESATTGTSPGELPEEDIPLPDTPEKPKRAPRRKSAGTSKGKATALPAGEDGVEKADPDEPLPAPSSEAATPKPSRSAAQQSQATDDAVLTINTRDKIESEQARMEAAWHDIRNAYITHRILTGQLSGIEELGERSVVAVVEHNGFRVVIPLEEMLLKLSNAAGQSEGFNFLRQRKLLTAMLGADIDFVVKGIDPDSRSIVASRREAMLRKQRTFYLTPNINGEYQVREGRIVQARVIALAEKAMRVEIFGVECSILARDLSWDWIGDARERYAVGDEILVRILAVDRADKNNISVRADARSISNNTSLENLKKCRVQCKYAGRITDIHKGIFFIRLTNGVNAVAHSCLDYRAPGRKDDVSFVVTRLDEETGVAVGMITRIIRQNL